jgi:hypothetical protein
MPPNKYGTDGPTVEIIFKTYKSSSRMGTLFLGGLKFHSLPPFPEGVIVLDISRNPELITLPVLPEGLRALNCRDNPNLTMITVLCPEGIKNAPAGYVFANCPKLKVQPNPDEPCGEFFERFKLFEKGRGARNAQYTGALTGLPHGPEAIVSSMLTGEKGNAYQQSDKLKKEAGIQGPDPNRKQYSGGKKTRKSKKRKSTRKSKLTRSR